jgi:hypothetical protein
VSGQVPVFQQLGVLSDLCGNVLPEEIVKFCSGARSRSEVVQWLNANWRLRGKLEKKISTHITKVRTELKKASKKASTKSLKRAFVHS